MRRKPKNDAERGLLSQLECRVKFARDNDRLRNGWVYLNGADFVLQHGVWYNPSPLPESVPRGIDRECFGNAWRLAYNNFAHYIEGYALATGVPVITHHAWVDYPNGRKAIDNTWNEPGTAYLGVKFPLIDVECGCSMLDNWEQGWPLFKKRWKK